MCCACACACGPAGISLEGAQPSEQAPACEQLHLQKHRCTAPAGNTGDAGAAQAAGQSSCSPPPARPLAAARMGCPARALPPWSTSLSENRCPALANTLQARVPKAAGTMLHAVAAVQPAHGPKAPPCARRPAFRRGSLVVAAAGRPCHPRRRRRSPRRLSAPGPCQYLRLQRVLTLRYAASLQRHMR